MIPRPMRQGRQERDERPMTFCSKFAILEAKMAAFPVLDYQFYAPALLG